MLLPSTRRHPLANDKADGTKWIPNVVFSAASQLFVMWGGAGDWFVATSKDGVQFDLVTPHTTSRLGGGTDGTGLFVDDDGVGYIAFADTNHVVSIERLAPDLLSSSKVNVSGFFPDDYVEVWLLVHPPSRFLARRAKAPCLYVTLRVVCGAEWQTRSSQ